MKVSHSLSKGSLNIMFNPTEGEINNTQSIKMNKRDCNIQLPEDWDINTVHPDVMALSILLIIYPFAGNKIELPFSISQDFHDLVMETTSKEIVPIDNNLKPRKSSDLSVPALCYSGGVDSTAALSLLPSTTQLFFLDRTIPKDMPKKTLYNKEAAHYACDLLREKGRSVYKIKSDLEYIRNPVGFPVDIANAVPALLLSDYVGLDSIAFGTIMESSFRIGHKNYRDYTKSTHYKRWGKLFSLVDLPFNLVVAGISEVGTSKIVLDSKYKGLAQSCMRGTIATPCMNCWKCFRKKLLDNILLKKDFENDYLDNLFSIKEAQRFLSGTPIKHENVISYITSKYNGNHNLMNILKYKTRGNESSFDWLEKWYSPSLELIPKKYQSFAEEKIKKHLNVMDKEEEKIVKQWNIESRISSEEYISYTKKLISELNKLKNSKIIPKLNEKSSNETTAHNDIKELIQKELATNNNLLQKEFTDIFQEKLKVFEGEIKEAYTRDLKNFKTSLDKELSPIKYQHKQINRIANTGLSSKFIKLLKLKHQ